MRAKKKYSCNKDALAFSLRLGMQLFAFLLLFTFQISALEFFMPVIQLLSSRHEYSHCFSAYWPKGAVVNATFGMNTDELENIQISNAIDVQATVISIHENFAVLTVPRYILYIYFILFYWSYFFACILFFQTCALPIV